MSGTGAGDYIMAMPITLLSLVACLTPVEECAATCHDLHEACEYDPADRRHAICETCDAASERTVETWNECVAGAEVSSYGWDTAACEAVMRDCGTYPY